MSDAAKLAHLVSWDAEFNRPIVDGKITHPVTGEIVPAGREGYVGGPPSIEFRLFNINSEINIIGRVQEVSGSLDNLYLAIARMVHEGVLKIWSINAGGYSFTVICQIKVSAEEFDIAWKNKFALKADWNYTEADWDEWFKETYPEAYAKAMEREKQRAAKRAQQDKSTN